MKIFKDNELTENRWRDLDDEDAVPNGGGWTVSFQRWIHERDALLAHQGPRGVRIEPADRIEDLTNLTTGLDVAVFVVPHFKDGRIYSNARLLRKRLRFTGEIRARGHVIPDQAQFLYRCGVDSVEVADDAPLDAWRVGLQRFQRFYQSSLREDAVAPYERSPLSKRALETTAPPAGR